MKIKFAMLIVVMLLLSSCKNTPPDGPSPPSVHPKEVLAYDPIWHQWNPVHGEEMEISSGSGGFTITLKSIGILSVCATDENENSIESQVLDPLEFNSDFQILNEPCEHIWLHECQTPLYLQEIEFNVGEAKRINVSVSIFGTHTLPHKFTLVRK